MQKPALRLLSALIAVIVASPAFAQEATAKAPAPPSDKDVFTLGQITVSARQEDASSVGTVTIDRQQLQDFSKDGLADALNLAAGVTTTAGAGARNEATLSVRGFDWWRVPLYMDGIRLYLPADNRIDFDRFLTPDLSEIQVSKGYVSVINGPDGMGGAINLVTRKPTKPVEGEIRASALLGNNGRYNGNVLYGSIGTHQDNFYLQASAEQRDVDQWRLPNSYTPTALQGSGDRLRSDKKDWRINLKAGFTPNATDEYSLNYVRQSGQKRSLAPVVKPTVGSIRVWDWPTWDTSSLYWLSHTQLDGKTYLKTKAYYNTFKNTLEINPPMTPSTSYYDDNAKGASIEVGTDHLPQQTLKAALHYRRDTHNEWNYLPNASMSGKVVVTPANFTEPKQTTIEDTWSLAVEDTWHATPKLDIVAGISRDARISKQAQEFGSTSKPGAPATPAVLFNYPTANSYATNYQIAAVYNYSDTGKLHASASDRTRFPTMFERFSSRFGGAISNPNLEPERALNLEIGIADQLRPGVRGEATLFHNKVKNAIVPVPLTGIYAGQSQNRNVGTATYQGAELGITAAVSPTLDIGANYAYIDTRLSSPSDPTLTLTGTPQNKAAVFAKWQPTPRLRIIPSLEYASSRWSSKADGTNGYVKTGQYTLLNLQVGYQITPRWDVSFTARNLTDRNYQLVDGYPQEGRNFMLTTRYQF